MRFWRMSKSRCGIIIVIIQQRFIYENMLLMQVRKEFL